MRRLFASAGLALILLLSGCHKVAYQTRLPPGGKVQEKQLTYWLYGTIGQHDVDLDELCPEGVAALHVEDSAFGLWNFLTLGIYAPRTLVVECTGAGGKR